MSSSINIKKDILINQFHNIKNNYGSSFHTENTIMTLYNNTINNNINTGANTITLSVGYRNSNKSEITMSYDDLQVILKGIIKINKNSNNKVIYSINKKYLIISYLNNKYLTVTICG